MKKSSAASAAVAACDHMRIWWLGTEEGDYTSMGVIPDKSYYDVDQDLCYSYPVTVKDGQWKIVEDLAISDFSKEKLAISMKELQEERMMALNR